MLIEGEAQRASKAAIGDFIATMTRAGNTSPSNSRLTVMFLQTAPDEFLVLGSGDAQITFSSDKPGPPITGILSIDEEFFEEGNWIKKRRLNGDENSQGQSLRLFSADLAEGRIYDIRLYHYK